MLAHDLAEYGPDLADSQYAPITASQIIPVPPTSPPPLPVDALGGQPPPSSVDDALPPEADQDHMPDEARAFRPQWRVILATRTAPWRQRAVDLGVRLWAAALPGLARARVWLARARAWLTLWSLRISGRAMNLTAQLQTAWREWIIARYGTSRSAGGSRAFARTSAPVPTGFGTRLPTTRDLEALQGMQERLRKLIAQLEMQRIAGTDDTPPQPLGLGPPPPPFKIAEVEGRPVGLVDAEPAPTE